MRTVTGILRRLGGLFRSAGGRLGRTLKHNWPLKLLAFGLTMVMNIYVRTAREPTVVNQVLLPLTLTPQPGQRVVRPGPEFRVRVSLQGPTALVREMVEQDALRLVFDEGSVKPGRTSKLQLDVAYPARYANRVEVSWAPRTVDVQLVSDQVKQYPVLVRPVNRPEGWEFPMLPTAEPAQVTVSGPAARVQAVTEVAAEFRVEPTSRISQIVPLRALDASGRDAPGPLRLDPAQVIVRGMLEEVVLQKRVPVQPALQFPEGFRVVDVRVSPSQVRIVGPSKIVAGVYLVETEPLVLPAVAGGISRDVAVRPPGDGLDVVPKSVHLDLQVEPAGRPRR